ncbi:MAG: DNA replication and repair protein RecF [Acidobacteriota bacterium]
MILTRITTDSFRNLASAEIAFHPKVNILVGLNGQGKTNLLEAIYFLATTKSFRTARVASLFRFGSPSVFVSGTVQREVEKTLSVGLEHGESKKRVLLINGERTPLASYVSAMTVFAYSSARLEILRGAPEERRRFLDRGIASIDPGYLEQVSRYGRVLRQRNALLHGGTTAGLDAWDSELAETAAVLQRARAAYAQALTAAFNNIVAAHRYRVGNMAIAYRPSALGDLKSIRREELRARMSLVGPQRDLLDFTVDGRAASEVLSGGEMKMIVLFLKFAKLELFRRRFDEAALFLLDDVDAELDLQILESLLAKMPPETQVFATSAKARFLQVLEAAPHRRLTIENGAVTTAEDL